VPTRASDSKQIDVGADVSKDLKSCVMLKEKIHLYANAANILEHI
jgi:hypothetical protein